MISKQTFLVALGCDTAGWYQARAVREVPGPGLEWQFHTGNEIGKLARSRLGPGTLLPFAPTERAVKATINAMADPDSTLLEATSSSLVPSSRADAVRRTAAGWELIEVKSALAPDEGKTKDEHIDDFAYTAFVAVTSGVRVERCHADVFSRDSRAGDLRLTELDVTAVVLARVAEFAERAPRIAVACAAVDRPLPVLQFVCRNCDFFATDCVGKGVPDPLFLLPRLSQKRFEAMKQHQRISAVPADPDLTGPQHRVFRAVRPEQPFSIAVSSPGCRNWNGRCTTSTSRRWRLRSRGSMAAHRTTRCRFNSRFMCAIGPDTRWRTTSTLRQSVVIGVASSPWR